ncbi:MAG: sugar phosphate nucleotidyltransferase [Micromonosporaceae bacterium]
MVSYLRNGAGSEFTEKPDIATARRYLASGEHLWNASMFVWRAASFLEHLARYRPALHAAFTKVAAAWNTTDRDTVLAGQWPDLEPISVDRAVMEPAAADGHVLAVPADMGWTDIGDWSTLGHVTANDAANSLLGDPGLITTSDSTECVIAAHSRRPVIVHGLQDVIVIDTTDALLICHRNQAQHVGRLAR